MCRRATSAVCGSEATAAVARLITRKSSISCAACQKNKYGLMVVPNTATIMVMVL